MLSTVPPTRKTITTRASCASTIPRNFAFASCPAAVAAVAAVRQRLREVRDRVEERLQTPAALDEARPCNRLVDDAVALPLVAQHEAQHQETILQAIALRHDLTYRPRFVRTDLVAPHAAAAPAAETVLVPAGAFPIGTPDRAWAYDNERPVHSVEVPAFRLARAAVTNAMYLAFMADGGYGRRSLWTAAGWSWLESSGAWPRRTGAPAAMGRVGVFTTGAPGSW
jgi:formylglycine-generating enzyme required for sulfatase activity